MLETWEMMCLRTENTELRTKLIDIIRQRHLLSENLTSSLEYVTFVEKNVRDSNGSVPKLTLNMVSKYFFVLLKVIYNI